MTGSLPDKQNNLDGEVLDNIKGLNSEQKTEIMATMEMYSGPLPHPDILKKYQDLYSHAAKDIIKNGVAESKHRRRLENIRVWVKLILAFIGIAIFGSLGYLFLKWSFDLIMSGHTIVGSIFGGGAFITLLGAVLSMVQSLTNKDDLKNSDNK